MIITKFLSAPLNLGLRGMKWMRGVWCGFKVLKERWQRKSQKSSYCASHCSITSVYKVQFSGDCLCHSEAQGTGPEDEASALLVFEACCTFLFDLFTLLSQSPLFGLFGSLVQHCHPLWPIASFTFSACCVEVCKSLLHMSLNLSLGWPSGLRALASSPYRRSTGMHPSYTQCIWSSQQMCVFQSSDYTWQFCFLKDFHVRNLGFPLDF